MFNDPYMLKQALNVNYGTNSIDTVGEMLFYLVDDFFTGILNPLAEIPTGLTNSGIITNVNWDLNFDGAWDPRVVSGLFFVKIEGLKTINMYPYAEANEELMLMNPKDFLTYALRNKINLDIPKTYYTLISSDLKVIDKQRVYSPLVINEKPTMQVGAVDENGSTEVSTQLLKFEFISDMLYNNFNSSNRIAVPLMVSLIVANQQNPLLALFQLGNDIVTDPLGTIIKSWFWILLGILFIFTVSMIYRNFKGNGTNINITNPIDKGGRG